VSLDALFQQAVSAIDAGDVAALERLLVNHPELVRARLDEPGRWLLDTIGRAAEGFFKRPYLLWFVAEDPVRNGRLPANIAAVAGAIIAAARREGVVSLQEQLDYALRLAAWSWIARECGVQIALIDVLVDAGAVPGRTADDALVNHHFAAAAHLVARGATLTLATALNLERWDDARRLIPLTSPRDKQFAFILAALNGRAEGLRLMLDAGIELNGVSQDLHSHAPALHHAVWSGSLDAVRVLVEAGADIHRKDSAEDATPLGWAEYAAREHARTPEEVQRYRAIVAYLRTRQ
jgi:peptide-methionine (S)-S-oxide reductase